MCRNSVYKVFGRINIDAYHDKFIIVNFPVQDIKIRNLFLTLVAPGRPKIKKYHFALHLMQVDNVAIQIRETTVRYFTPDLASDANTGNNATNKSIVTTTFIVCSFHVNLIQFEQ